MLPRLLDALSGGSKASKIQWLNALKKVWENYYIFNNNAKDYLRNNLIQLLGEMDSWQNSPCYYQTYFKDIFIH